MQEKDNLTSLDYQQLDLAVLEDNELVSYYKTSISEKGLQSNEANQVINHIFLKYTNLISVLARQKGIAEAYIDDIKQLVFLTVWQRLNGKEEITNLKGLILHSFHCRAATYFERTYHKKAAGQAIQTISLATPGLLNEGNSNNFQMVKGAGGREIYLDVTPTTAKFSAPLIEKLYDISENTEEQFLHAEHVAQVRKQLRWIFENIPAKYGTALLQQLGGAELKEIAQTNGWTIDQTKKYVVRGRQWIAKHRHLFGMEAA